jgi:hypothetical protein
LVAVTGVDVYRAAFVARCEAVREPGQSKVDAPGICGLLASPGHLQARLLIAEDRAGDRLAAQLFAAEAGMITVFAAAPRPSRNWTGDDGRSAPCRTAVRGSAGLPRCLNRRTVDLLTARIRDRLSDGSLLSSASVIRGRSSAPTPTSRRSSAP